MKVFQTESLCLILPMKAKTSGFLGNVFFIFFHTLFLIKSVDRIAYTLCVYAINGKSSFLTQSAER